MFPVHVKIHHVIKEYYLSIYGSDTIEVSNNSSFGLRVRNILQLPPGMYKKCSIKNPTILTFMVPDSFAKDKKGNTIKTKFKGYLDDRRQYFLSLQLILDFRLIFHNAMLGYCRASRWEPGCQKTAIYSFCDTYKIAMNKVNYAMLKKSWDRSQEKKRKQINFSV